MKTHSRINQDGELPLTPLQKDYLKKHAGKEVIIMLDERTNLEMIGFFEGAVVPSFFYQSEVAFRDFGDARNCLKLEFFPIRVTNIKGKMTKTAGSMATLYESKKRMSAFLEKVHRYFDENEFEFPDPEDYKRWRDSAPSPGEIYPPLQVLIDEYKRKLK